MIDGPFTGGCQCGAIQFEVDRVFDVIYCHCNHCRRSSGAPVLLTAGVAAKDFRLVRGSPREYQTSESGRSFFCGTCGAGLYGEYFSENHPFATDGRYFSVRIGAFEDPERIPPQVHQFVRHKLSWFDTADGLPRVQGNKLPHPDKRLAAPSSPSTPDNRTLIERIHTAFESGQHPEVSLFAPDVIWHVEGKNPLARDYIGRDAVFVAFRAFEEQARGTLRVRLLNVAATNDYAFAVLLAIGDREGQTYECFEYDVYRIANGAVTEFWSFSSNQRATDAFWS